MKAERSPRLSRRLILGAAGALALTPAAYAHRPLSVLSTIDWNPTTKTIEVIHRLHAHDVEVGIEEIGGGGVIDLSTVRGQAQLIVYLEPRFILTTPQGPVQLEIVGAELDGLEAIVYQEVRSDEPWAEVTVDDQILRDVFDRQTNLVNIHMGKATRTLIFAGKDGPKTARRLL